MGLAWGLGWPASQPGLPHHQRPASAQGSSRPVWLPLHLAPTLLSPSLSPHAGRRNFAAFLGQYLPPLPGRYVDVDTRRDLGTCPDLAAVTHGQRPGIGGAADRVYAAGKDLVSGGCWRACCCS